MASPLSDPLSCDELTLDWDTDVARGAAAGFPVRGGSPSPRSRGEDSDCESGSVSEDEEDGSEAYWQEQLKRQASLAPLAAYPEWHAEVKVQHRPELVEWIGRTCYDHRMQLKTQVLAVSLLDRYASRDNMDGLAGSGWRAAVTALLLAAKLEESSVPHLFTLQATIPAAWRFSTAHWEAQELVMLQTLGFTLSAPTAVCFLDFLVRRAAPHAPARRRELRSRARELLRRSLPDHGFLRFKASQVAAATLKRALLEAASQAGAAATTTALAAVDRAAGDLVAVATCLRALDAAWPRAGAVSSAPAVQTRAALQLRLSPRKDGPDRDESPTSTLAGMESLDLDGHSREASPDHLAAPLEEDTTGVASEPDDVAPPARIPRRRAFRGIAAAAAAGALLPAKRVREDDGLL